MPTPDPLIQRLQRLEESQGFAERTIENLSDEIAMLNRSLAETQARLKRFEARLDQLQQPPESADTPDSGEE